MSDNDIALMAHLMRRAGFGAQYSELQERAAKGYEATVEELLNPSEDTHRMDLDLGERYFLEWNHFVRCVPEYIAFRMINSYSQLEEKMVLFWHGILCTADSKTQSYVTSHQEWEMLRRFCMGNFKDLLIEISKDPAMIYFLDNCLSHKEAINENYGRELLELFSMGVGNYSEKDVKEAARAFTGWTIGNTEYMTLKCMRDSVWPYGRLSFHFEYKEDDHDNGDKEFLGHKGNLNGEDIVDIICKEPATAAFLSRHMYSFFVADEAPVPEWPYKPPRDPDAINALSKVYFESGYDIAEMLKFLFNSEFFKAEEARYQRVKSPAELMAGVLKLTEEFERPKNEMNPTHLQATYMGQWLLNPPSVEGWHWGTEWIDSGALVERVNFASERLGNLSSPGVQTIVDHILSNKNGSGLIAEDVVKDALKIGRAHV